MSGQISIIYVHPSIFPRQVKNKGRLIRIQLEKKTVNSILNFFPLLITTLNECITDVLYSTHSRIVNKAMLHGLILGDDD